MAKTITTGWIGTNGSTTAFSSPVSLGISSGAGYYPAGAVTITYKSTNPQGGWQRQSSNINSRIMLYLCDSSGNNTVAFCEIKGFVSQGNMLTNPPKSFNITNTSKLLKNTALYLKATGDTSLVKLYSQITITLTLQPAFTHVTAGSLIKKTDLSQRATPDDATYIKYRAQFSAGASCSASTFNTWLDS